jgi:hypothetical protein
MIQRSTDSADSGDPGDYHPSPDLLRRFVSGLLAGTECQPMVRHLLRGCPSCRKIANEIWRSTEDARLGRALQPKAPWLAVVD